MAEKQNKTAEKTVDIPQQEQAGTPADVNAMVEEILKKAQMSAEEIVNNAVAKAEEIISQAQKTSVSQGAQAPAEPDDGEEEVEIRLPLKKGESDLFVAVNGVGIQIQRGKPVKVKKKFAKAIENSVTQDEATMMMVDGLVADYESKKDKLI